MKGTVKFYNAKKNFGFIAGENNNDYFVHKSQLETGLRLKEGTEVEFEPTETEKGLQAEKVTKA